MFKWLNKGLLDWYAQCKLFLGIARLGQLKNINFVDKSKRSANNLNNNKNYNLRVLLVPKAHR